MLTEELVDLCTVCRVAGISIVLPETTLLEFERRHSEFAEKEMHKLAEALLLLERFSISHDDVDPHDVVKEPNLVALLEATGVSVEVIPPSFEDYREAHRRACKHLPPSTEKKSDEMRDVIIWLVAVGTAQRSTGAVLIAKDTLFHDARVDDEARAVGLIRVKSVESAIEHVRGLRPSLERFAAILALAVREDLGGQGIRLPEDADRYHVSDPVFTLDDKGLLAKFRLDVEQDGVKQFGAYFEIEVREGTIKGVSMTEVESATMPSLNNEITLVTNRMIDLEMAETAAGLGDVADFGGQSESEDR